LKYSQIQKYFDAVKSYKKVTWNNYTYDFFPYQKVQRLVWAGYFSSNPFIKRKVVELSTVSTQRSKIT